MNNTDTAHEVIGDLIALRDRMRHGDNPRHRLLSFRIHETTRELVAIFKLIAESEGKDD